MKSFLLEIFILDKDTSYHNKTSEPFLADDVRRVIAMLDEVKADLIDTLRTKRQFVENKEKDKLKV